MQSPINEDANDESSTPIEETQTDVQSILAAVEEDPYPGSSTSLEVKFSSGSHIRFSTDNGGLMRCILGHDDRQRTELKVKTDDHRISRMSPSDFFSGRITAVEADFDPDDLKDGINPENWGKYSDLVSESVNTAISIGGQTIIGVEDYL